MKTSLYIQNIQHIIIRLRIYVYIYMYLYVVILTFHIVIRINNGVIIYKDYVQFLLFLLLFKLIPRQRGSESPVVEPKQEVIDPNSSKLRNRRTVLMEMV